MVQIYNPNVVGKQIFIDVKNIESDKLKTVENLKPFMDKIIEELDLNVVGECSHQLKKIMSPKAIQWFIYCLKVIYLFILLFIVSAFSIDFIVSAFSIDACYFTRGN